VGRFNLAAHFLDRNLERGAGGRTALVWDGGSITYAGLADLANRVGNVLRDLGVERGDRVLLALGDGVEFVASWYAVVKIGAVVAELYTFLNEKDYEYYLTYSDARVLVADRAARDRLRAVVPRCPGLGRLLLMGETGPLKAREVRFEDAVRAASARLEAAPTTADDIALWKFTTGSTGAPKAAVHRHANPLRSFERYALGVLGLGPDDLVLPVPKLFFGYARDLTALFTFGVGAAGVVFPERSTPERLFDLIGRHRPTVLVQVPTMVRQMLDHERAAGADLSCLRLCVSSGEALPAELHLRWRRRFGVELLNGVGSSELYHIFVSNRPGAVRVGSLGQVVPGYVVRLVDEAGADVRAGEPGRAVVRGESAALGYWDPDRGCLPTFAGGWVASDDVLRRDDDGFHWFVGRADSMLKVGGIWVSPTELEAALAEHAAVADCAVVGYQEAGLTLPRAYVVLRPEAEAGGRGLAQELQAFCRSRLSPHKYPRDVRFVAGLPRTPSGKLLRRELEG
jgi:benzoate-CoA ligase family protein